MKCCAIAACLALLALGCSQDKEPARDHSKPAATPVADVDPATLALPTDPFCGMKLKKDHVAATYTHDGKQYGFCTEYCRDSFAADPAKYLANPGSGEMGQ
jgi:YHS domain-containing protein